MFIERTYSFIYFEEKMLGIVFFKKKNLASFILRR